MLKLFIYFFFFFTFIFIFPIYSQGVTTASISGYVSSTGGEYLPNANVIVIHLPTGTQLGASTRENGLFNIPNMKIGGPYTITVSFVGYITQKQEGVFLNLGQNVRLDFVLSSESLQLGEVVVTSEEDEVLNSSRTGAVTFIDPMQVMTLPSVKRSTRDLIRLDPRSDGNYSFGGKNWLYNNISVDGSYFNNPFGLDDPAPGGQTNSEPVPFDAVEQIKVSIAPYDVREGGFTGAGINTVTKSGTNNYRVTLYSFIRNESFIGNEVSGNEVIANPDLSFNQSGFAVSGPLIKNKLFLFINGEIERRDDPGTNFVASTTGLSEFGISRVRAAIMDSIRNRMIDVYGYDPGPYQGFIHETNNEKFIVKLDWNVNDNNRFSFRYNFLNANRDLPPHPFVLSAGGTGRGPNENSLPFKNSGYQINNKLNSFATEINSNYTDFANRLFVSYNRFRDFRDPFSSPFPTIEIAENGVTYTTVGHEPFSIQNILDQDVWQFTNNFSYFIGKHVFTVGGTFEKFSFFNSFNIFRHGVFFLPAPPTSIGTTFSSLDEFFTKTTPGDPNFIDFNAMIGTGPFKGEFIDVGQLAFYAQDEFLVSEMFNITFGLRVDIPVYITEPVDNPFSRGLTALDENDNPESVDQSKLPGATPLFSPRVGFNLALTEDRSTQLRGGTGIFTGRIPFVWIGNVISNPGANPNLYPTGPQIPTQDNSTLAQSFDLNAMDPDFKWPQVWTTNIALDHKLPWDVLGTLEIIYGKDINAVFVRNADLVTPVRTLPDGRPYYGGAGNNELNAAYPGEGAGIYVIDNTDEGYNFTVSTQFRKQFESGLNTSLSYTFLQAKNTLKSTEIASVLFAENPVQGDPNKPVVSFSEFGNRHRIIGGATYRREWSENFATSFGLFVEIAEGNRFAGAGGNRYSFVYSGDVNGDGSAANDLIYIPANSGEIIFDPITDGGGNVITTPAQQWEAFNAFIEQDNYLKENRGKIAERFGDVNPWFVNIDLRLLQDFNIFLSGQKHTFQLSVDVLNVPNLLNSDWGVRQVATSSATSPLELVRFDFDSNDAPVFNFNPETKETFIDDPGLLSRYQVQVGLRYIFE